jgi:hypothetical protein
MLEPIFGSRVRELVLCYLSARKQGYAREIAEFYQTNLSPVQTQLNRLESGNVLVSTLSGKTRVYSFNPRYPFLQELLNLINKTIAFLPQQNQDELFLVRKRPRRKNKPL